MGKATKMALMGIAFHDALTERDREVERRVRTKIAEEIRAEQVCPCIEELEVRSWHPGCRGAEFAARIAEGETV